MAETTYLAVDLGASSGRVVAGSFDGSRIRLDEVHRFPNGPVEVLGTLHWDLLGQWAQIRHGLRAAGERFGQAVESVGVDTWGVDFALLGTGDTLLANPVHYRDARTAGMMELAIEQVGRETIFQASGLQFLPFNTLYQLLALKHANSPLLEMGRSLLMMPDVFHWLLSGEKANEYTDATTTQFFDVRRNQWATGLLEQLGLPTHLLGPVVQPGTKLGALRGLVAADTGLVDVDVILPGTHDTASAVLAVPAEASSGEAPEWCYISSGTWSLMGVELSAPVITDRCREFNFTNEGGVAGTVRLLKNIAGLWLAQECRRVWAAAGKSYEWDELAALAAAAPAGGAVVDPDAAEFLAPADMPQAIVDYCGRTGQTAPSSEGAFIRTATESIALKSRRVLEMLEELTGGRLETIHIVGGGVQNKLLCQATANACGRRVLAGPVEATALGNVMMQAVAAGQVGSITEAREIIRNSFPLDEYLPKDQSQWEDAYARFQKLPG